MTPEDINAMKDLCNKATPGPWHCGHQNENTGDVDIMSVDGYDVCENASYGEDASFIIKSRTFIPEAISEIEKLQKQVEILKGSLTSAGDIIHDEFCGGEHNRYCRNINEALKACEEMG